MATGSQRYKNHKVWDTLTLKRDALAAARYDDARTEQKRLDIIEWRSEALKTRQRDSRPHTSARLTS